MIIINNMIIKHNDHIIVRWILNTLDTQNTWQQWHSNRIAAASRGIIQAYYQMTRKEYAWYMSRHKLEMPVTRKEYVRHILDIYLVWEMGWHIPGICRNIPDTDIDLVVRYMEHSRNMSEYPTSSSESTDSRCQPKCSIYCIWNLALLWYHSSSMIS